MFQPLSELDENRYPYVTYVWGPPGCGKTSFLVRQIENAVRKYGPNAVLVTSFTKSAARELASRGLPVAPEHVGTLHALCLRALGLRLRALPPRTLGRDPQEKITIAETRLGLWNKEHPGLRLSMGSVDVDELALNPDFAIRTPTDRLLGEFNILRSKMIPQELWPAAVRDFFKIWKGWWQNQGAIDFTGLLEDALAALKMHPANPSVIVVDEAQDLSLLQWAVVRQWSQYAHYVIIAGDDDQCLYAYAGADLKYFMQRGRSEGDVRGRHALSQSYRIPQKIHRFVESWIRQIADREAKPYHPTSEPGEVRLLARGSYRAPEAILKDALSYLRQKQEVMFLSTCAYMLEPLRNLLRKEGWPFWNPYRLERREWNPLTPPPPPRPRKDQDNDPDNDLQPPPPGTHTLPCHRLLAFLKPTLEDNHPWTAKDLELWTAWMRHDILQEAAREKLKKWNPAMPVEPQHLAEIFHPRGLESLTQAFSEESLEPLIGWWLDRLEPKRRSAALYPVAVLRRGGAAALKNKPQIVIGTIHSVKGAQTDVTYLFPDLSRAGFQQWSAGGEKRNAVIRSAYVGSTRSRKSLVICDGASSDHIPLARHFVQLHR
jgi:superfamily I DNA/RNA helicase